jgi:hypothetical protein
MLRTAHTTFMRATTETIDIAGVCVRAALGAINEEARTVDLTFSTGAGVLRTDWYSGKQYLEVLSMDPAHVRLDRLNAGAPLLDSHSAWSVGDVLGVVEAEHRADRERPRDGDRAIQQARQTSRRSGRT